MLVHSSSTPRPSLVQLLAALYATVGYDRWTFKVAQAYMKIHEQLARDVRINPAMELDLARHRLLKLRKALYVLADPGDYWHANLAEDSTREAFSILGCRGPGIATWRT